MNPKGSQRSGHASLTETGDDTLTETVVEKPSSQEIALYPALFITKATGTLVSTPPDRLANKFRKN